MFEINNLRVLNDYLNQTIDALVRSQRLNGAIPGVGLSHSPYAVPNFVGSVPGVAGIGLDPTVGGLSHSPFLAATSPFGAAYTGTPFTSTYAGVVDPFLAQRGLSHTPAFTGAVWGQAAWSPLAVEIARQQQIAATAIAARQQMLDAMVRGYAI